MHRLVILLAILFAISVPNVYGALTDDEVELLRKAGVSERQIQEMNAPSGEAAKAKEDAAPAAREAAPAPVARPEAAPEEKPPFDFTDWNGDGVKDIISGTTSGELNVYINKGSNKHPDFEDREEVQDGDVDSGSNSMPCIVDWDGDGLKDVIMGNHQGSVEVFINSGTNSSPKFKEGRELQKGDVDSGSYSAPAVADWDGDGRMDLILGNFKGGIQVFINDGEPGHPHFDDEEKELKVKVEGFSTPFVTKNYVNGLFDIVCGSSDGRVYRFINTGTKSNPVFSSPERILVNEADFKLPGCTTVIATDWDGDGKEDLVVANRMTKQTVGTSATEAVSKKAGIEKVYSRVYLLTNVGTNQHPRYNDATELLRDYKDIDL